MIYGNPQIHIDDDHTDRIGIRTLVLSQIWQPSRWPLSLAELDEEKPDVPAVPGGVMFIGEQTRRTSGVLRTTWTFEGINGDGKSVTFKDRSNSVDYSFEPGFSQVPITRHPYWSTLKTKFGAQLTDNQVTWPEYIPASDSSGPVVGDDQGKANPMLGQDDFVRMEGTYSFRYAATTLGAALAGVGKIATSLPGRAPSFPRRNWLKAPSPWQRRGPVLEITEVYWLSGEGGWPAEIYSDKEKSGDSGTSNPFDGSFPTGDDPGAGFAGSLGPTEINDGRIVNL
ncbi:MAG TPA: hypothetical protein VK961_01675 [Chthoniobacter sp.]|nr:hypothetical protein [Chthoniobacter sp.]